MSHLTQIPKFDSGKSRVCHHLIKRQIVIASWLWKDITTVKCIKMALKPRFATGWLYSYDQTQCCNAAIINIHQGLIQYEDAVLPIQEFPLWLYNYLTTFLFHIYSYTGKISLYWIWPRYQLNMIYNDYNDIESHMSPTKTNNFFEDTVSIAVLHHLIGFFISNKFITDSCYLAMKWIFLFCM